MTTNEMINNWGPAIIVCLTILIGLIFNNQRISDLKDSINQRLDGIDKSMNQRFIDLQKYLDVKFKSIEDRLDKLENPVKIK